MWIPGGKQWGRLGSKDHKAAVNLSCLKNGKEAVRPRLSKGKSSKKYGQRGWWGPHEDRGSAIAELRAEEAPFTAPQGCCVEKRPQEEGQGREDPFVLDPQPSSLDVHKSTVAFPSCPTDLLRSLSPPASLVFTPLYTQPSPILSSNPRANGLLL